MSDYLLRSARYLAAECLQAVIQPGDTAVDATMGNGHDTCFLAGLVSEQGRVIAFDVQAQAVEQTRQRLDATGLLPRAELHLMGHERMAEVVQAPVRAVVFNLGWLPSGDKSVTTHWDTTRVAVLAALELLLPLGVLVVCVYPGHPAGDMEREELTKLLKSLPPQRFNVLHQVFLNAGDGAPQCYVVQRQ